MAIGFPPAKADLDTLIGSRALDFVRLYNNAKQAAQRLSLMQDTDLEAIGYSAADVTAIHQFETFCTTLCGVFDGTGTVATATNFLAQVSGIIGAGQ